MLDALTDRRLQLFAFTQADHKHRYLAILAAFDTAREQSRLQLDADDIVALVEGLDSTDDARAALDQLHDWDVLQRVQDERRVRTIAEYQKRHSIYLMTELGWLAYTAVRDMLDAQPGEAELQRLVLRKVLEELRTLHQAVNHEKADEVAFHLGEIHRMLDDLSKHAARFLIATSELSATWEANPDAFIIHKRRLLGHLDGFLTTLSSLRPLLAAAVAKLQPQRKRLIDLAASASGSALELERARTLAGHRFDGITAWFVDAPDKPSQAASLDARTSRAIRDLTNLLRRVFDATAGGISRASRLEDLAAWFMACPDDASAHALAQLMSGLGRARHFGAPPASADIEPSASWWTAPPAPIDTMLRKRGRPSPPAPPRPVPDRSVAASRLRSRQRKQRDIDHAASTTLVGSIATGTPLDDAQLRMLLRLLSRTLHARTAASTRASTVYGRLRMTLTPSEHDTLVPTVRGILRMDKFNLIIESSTRSTKPPVAP